MGFNLYTLVKLVFPEIVDVFVQGVELTPCLWCSLLRYRRSISSQHSGIVLWLRIKGKMFRFMLCRGHCDERFSNLWRS